MATNIETTQNFVSDKILAVYSKQILAQGKDYLMLDKYAVKKYVKVKSNTRKAFAFRYKRMLPALTPLEEYDGTQVRQGNHIEREEVEFSVAKYGDFIRFNDDLPLTDLDAITERFLEKLGEQAALTQEHIMKEEVFSGTNVIYAGQTTSRSEMAEAQARLTQTDLKIGALKLKRQKARKIMPKVDPSVKYGTAPVKSRYPFLAHANMIEDLRELKNFIPAEKYTSQMGEEGTIGDFAIIEYDLAPEVEVNGTWTYQAVAFGKEFFAGVSMTGKEGIQTIIHNIGSGGHGDPLDEQGTFGWKMYAGAAILNQAWGVRFESTASIDVVDEKTYYNSK